MLSGHHETPGPASPASPASPQSHYSPTPDTKPAKSTKGNGSIKSNGIAAKNGVKKDTKAQENGSSTENKTNGHANGVSNQEGKSSGKDKKIQPLKSLTNGTAHGNNTSPKEAAVEPTNESHLGHAPQLEKQSNGKEAQPEQISAIPEQLSPVDPIALKEEGSPKEFSDPNDTTTPIVPQTPSKNSEIQSDKVPVVEQIVSPDVTQPKEKPKEKLKQPPKNQTWSQKYEYLLLSNAGRLANLESSVRNLSYLATGQMQDVELVTETLYSVLQLLSLYHDKIINNAIQKLAKDNGYAAKDPETANEGKGNPKGAKTSLLGDPQAIRPSMHNRYTQWAVTRSKIYRYLAIILTLLKNTELVWEMFGKRGFSISLFGKQISLGLSRNSTSAKESPEKSRWRAILYLEGTKALLRLGLLATTQGRTVLGTPIPERDVDPQRIVRDRRGNFKILDEDEVEEYHRLEQQRELLRLAGELEDSDAEDDGTNKHSTSQPHSNGSRLSSWWRMPRRGLGLPQNPNNVDIEAFLSRKVLSVEDVRSPDGLVHRLSKTGLAAEVVYIIRPLVYASLVALYSTRRRQALRSTGSGTKDKRFIYGSWTPWLVGVAMEFGARQLALKSQQEHLAGGLRSLTKLEADEYKERATNLGWWMLRGAMYENWTRPLLGRVTHKIEKIPLVNIVALLFDDYLYLFDNYHFTASTL